MALAGRSSRSGGGRRLLIAALVVTILVVLLDASLKSRSPAPAENLTAQAWVDRVLPRIAESTTEGDEVAHLRTAGLGTPAATITATLDAVSAGAADAYRSVTALGDPVATGGAPGLLEACLLARSKAAATLASSVSAALTAPAAAAGAGAGDPDVTGVATAAGQLQVADQAYDLFVGAVPKSLGVTMPASTWITDASLYQPSAVAVWLSALRAGTSLTPLHRVTIDSVSTNPPPVGVPGGVQDIPPTRAISVTIVVADTGNQPERDLTVTAAVTPSAPGAATSVREFASLAPGTSDAVTVGPLVPPSGAPATLTITVTPLAGSPTPPATLSLPIEVAAPPPPSTTTTVPPTPAATTTTTTRG